MKQQKNWSSCGICLTIFSLMIIVTGGLVIIYKDELVNFFYSKREIKVFDRSFAFTESIKNTESQSKKIHAPIEKEKEQKQQPEKEWQKKGLLIQEKENKQKAKKDNKNKKEPKNKKEKSEQHLIKPKKQDKKKSDSKKKPITPKRKKQQESQLQIQQSQQDSSSEESSSESYIVSRPITPNTGGNNNGNQGTGGYNANRGNSSPATQNPQLTNFIPSSCTLQDSNCRLSNVAVQNYLNSNYNLESELLTYIDPIVMPDNNEHQEIKNLRSRSIPSTLNNQNINELNNIAFSYLALNNEFVVKNNQLRSFLERIIDEYYDYKQKFNKQASNHSLFPGFPAYNISSDCIIYMRNNYKNVLKQHQINWDIEISQPIWPSNQLAFLELLNRINNQTIAEQMKPNYAREKIWIIDEKLNFISVTKKLQNMEEFQKEFQQLPNKKIDNHEMIRIFVVNSDILAKGLQAFHWTIGLQVAVNKVDIKNLQPVLQSKGIMHKSYYEYDDFEGSVFKGNQKSEFQNYLIQKRIKTRLNESIFLAQGALDLAQLEEYTDIMNVFLDKLKSDDPLIKHTMTLNTLQNQYKQLGRDGKLGADVKKDVKWFEIAVDWEFKIIKRHLVVVFVMNTIQEGLNNKEFFLYNTETIFTKFLRYSTNPVIQNLRYVDMQTTIAQNQHLKHNRPQLYQTLWFLDNYLIDYTVENFEITYDIIKNQ